ncbi:MAG: riboflavin synthase [Proteobacteria bacterium]|nr:MAG: riboflavin synthase [Pseudomonadota bacterium]
MFTGIVEKRAAVVSLTPQSDQGVIVELDTAYSDLTLGESVAVNGVCLTVVEWTPAGRAKFFIGSESLRLTNLSSLQLKHTANVERAMLASTRLSGHWVQGHVDGLAKLVELESENETYRLKFEMPRELIRYCVSKGSITLNGVSLTLNDVSDSPLPTLTVHLIPHTWSHTNLSELKIGDTVNVEVDVLAKYVERLCHPYLKPST